MSKPLRRRSGWTETRETFRHGNLPEALVGAALKRLEAEGAGALSLRELARDAGVNHRAVYRHFPDKLSLLARVAEEGWRRLAHHIEKEVADGTRGEEALVAAGVGYFRFARANRNLMELMSGPRISEQGAFPALEATLMEAMAPFIRGFVELGIDPASKTMRAFLLVSALTGINDQILHRRLRVPSKDAAGFVAEISRMLIKGLR